MKIVIKSEESLEKGKNTCFWNKHMKGKNTAKKKKKTLK